MIVASSSHHKSLGYNTTKDIRLESVDWIYLVITQTYITKVFKKCHFHTQASFITFPDTLLYKPDLFYFYKYVM